MRDTGARSIRRAAPETGTLRPEAKFTRQLQNRPCLRAETPLRRAGMGKPLFKASDSGRFDILREGEGCTQCELWQGSGA